MNCKNRDVHDYLIVLPHATSRNTGGDALCSADAYAKVWGVGANADGSNPYALIEQRVSANLSNQFEWPVLFYAASIILIARPELYQPIHVWFAWLFVFGRVIHSAVQICTTNVRLRGAIFTINFVAVICIWGVLGLSVIDQ
ncbi:MAPEG family protein [Marinimicrobium sp. ABcell2]|uniref:MAPEG family protein n=1 Tax=Marinimicrobium sp. ABcell2 TaxID=3069751 RepID=UPI00359CB69F